LQDWNSVITDDSIGDYRWYISWYKKVSSIKTN